MSDNVVSIQDRVMPVRVIDNKTETAYELDFSRESVKFAENRGFKVDELTVFPVTRIPELFYYAFRKNHKNVALSLIHILQEDYIAYEDMKCQFGEVLGALDRIVISASHKTAS